jgi:hypothetical protein
MRLSTLFPIQITILSLMVIHTMFLLKSSSIHTPHKIILGVVLFLFTSICVRILFKK